MKCPHCQADVDNAVTKEFMNTEIANRLAAKNAENTALKESLATAQERAGNYDAIIKERDQLKGQVSQMEQRVARDQAYGTAGVAADPKVRQVFEMLYESYKVDAGDEAQPFEEWLTADEGAKAHPLLAGQFQAQGQGQGQAQGQGHGQGQGQEKPPNTLPRPNPGGDPPGPSRMTPQQVQEYLRSPEYRAMSLEDQRKKMAELQAQARGG